MWAESDLCRYLFHADLKDRNPYGLKKSTSLRAARSCDRCEAAHHLLAVGDGEYEAGNTRVCVVFRGPLSPHVIRGSTVDVLVRGAELDLHHTQQLQRATLNNNVTTALRKVPSGCLFHQKYASRFVAISFSCFQLQQCDRTLMLGGGGGEFMKSKCVKQKNISRRLFSQPAR